MSYLKPILDFQLDYSNISVKLNWEVKENFNQTRVAILYTSGNPDLLNPYYGIFHFNNTLNPIIKKNLI